MTTPDQQINPARYELLTPDELKNLPGVTSVSAIENDVLRGFGSAEHEWSIYRLKTYLRNEAGWTSNAPGFAMLPSVLTVLIAKEFIMYYLVSQTAYYEITDEGRACLAAQKQGEQEQAEPITALKAAGMMGRTGGRPL